MLPKRGRIAAPQAPPDRRDDTRRQRAEGNAQLRANHPVLDRPADEGADPHEDREGGQGERSVSPDQRLEVLALEAAGVRAP
jgi:hypothetical protein